MGCSGPTAPARPPPSACSPPCCAPTAGRARVLATTWPGGGRGTPPVALAGQSATIDDDLTGTENLVLLAGSPGWAGRRPGPGRELVAAFGLEAAAARQVKRYSGGMRGRLDLAASILVRADVYFLDEPTTGLDPASRAQVWDLVRALAAGGATVLLTTQYLDEADQLAGRVAVIDHGRVVAEGTPGQLKASGSAGTVRVRLADPANGRGRGASCPGCSASPSRPRPIRRRWMRAPQPATRSPPRCPGWPARASRSASSPSASPAWTRCSSPSPATTRYWR